MDTAEGGTGMVDLEATAKRRKVTIQFGELIISSDFDSGNLDRVEECRSLDADTREFNLWTAPDCAGTEYENCNRTWFYFSVSVPANYGPGKILRFSIQNLNKQSRLYQQGLTPMIKTYPGRGVWERLRDRPEWEPAEGGGLKLSFQLSISDSRHQTTYMAFCFPFSYNECQRLLAKLEAKHSSEVEEKNLGSDDTQSAIDSRIYFHRELLCYSLENRRIDLITVSSYEGISEEREPPLPSLFPVNNNYCVRARKFPKKKVFYLTSRVHPGESPSSHVFNGFLHFILRPDDARAKVLRQNFVFKMIPMLNPDGVFHGHYRTDTRGVNLNRVYLDPSPELHPSIFAARSLMLHYHHKQPSTKKGTNEPSHQQLSCDSSLNSNSSNNNAGGSEMKLLSISERGCSCVCSSFGNGLSSWCGSHEAVSQHSTCTTIAPHSSLKQLKSPRSSSLKTLVMKGGDHRNIPLGLVCPSNKSGLTSSSPALLTRNSNHTHIDRDNSVSTQQLSTVTPIISDKDSDERTTCQDTTCTTDEISEALLTTKNSGIAFYVDLHAHATKRGVFMYGNYFENALEQAENMLFPKVISLNSPHLDFEHCVFSEKNMYTADKRDGLSKEGSGRVAMHKATGTIHCYTLECNYNSGRQSNALTAATLDNGRASPSMPFSPMGHRFSIQDFEQVGRALAISALDMHQLNPWSRLPTTEYGSVAGIRQSLIQRIRTSRSKKSAKQRATHLAMAEHPVSNEQVSPLPSSTAAGHSHGNDPAANASNRREDSNSHSNSTVASLLPPSTGSSTVQTCRTVLIHRQKARHRPDRIAAEVAQVTEAKRKVRGKHLQPKGVGLSPLQGGAAPLRSIRSSSLRKQHDDKQAQLSVMKPSLQQVVFPLYKPPRLQTGYLKDQLPSLGSKDGSKSTLSSSTSGDGSSKLPPTQLLTEPSQQSLKVAAPRNKLLNRRSRNILLKQSSGRSLPIAQKDGFPQERPNSTSRVTVSDSEITCKLSKPGRLQLRYRSRAFTSTQVRQ